MNKYGTILIVDDNASILTAMHYLLDDTFERVLTTTQPEEILKLMAQQPVDLVLLDMNFTLGVNNGNEGLFWLRTIRKQHPQTPVVLLTAYADVNLAVKGLKNGAADFITKPWDNDELVRICRTKSSASMRWKRNTSVVPSTIVTAISLRLQNSLASPDRRYITR